MEPLASILHKILAKGQLNSKLLFRKIHISKRITLSIFRNI